MGLAGTVLVLVLFVSLASCVIPRRYPLYKQCDPRWGKHWMGANTSSSDTVCAQGCAMSSLSMALGGRGYLLPEHQTIDPGTLNQWLRTHNGYECVDGDCDNLVLDAANRIEAGIKFISEKEKPSLETVKEWIKIGNPIAIAHVRNRTHFVLLTGYYDSNNSTLDVNDPYYESDSYDYSQIADIITYELAKVSTFLNLGEAQ
eukprot:TRINITY_DN324_c0_g1_i1.p1 TRINITY_DN324_c0_g1~~TRINITY_DN324_c0_g1_i1.p1  ORF type:complete len:202 (+),score=41.30 TRINITY_DN324_c0_g1_i1:85-690(+)